ncbi:MAG TPA: ATP-binding protein, partial [Verrucomicrobiae bacterium]
CISMGSDNSSPLLTMLKQWCVSASAVCLLWGSSVFHNLRPRQTIFGLFIGFLCVWSYIGAYHLEEGLHVELPIFGLIGGASITTAWAFYKFRLRRDYIGAGLLSVGFFFWGVYLTGYPFFQRMTNLTSSIFLISAVLQLFIAVSMIILVLEEVRSSNKLAFQQLRSQKTEKAVLQKRVASTEERYRRMFDQAHEGIIIAAADDLRVLEMNQTARQLLGTSNGSGKALDLIHFLQASNPEDPIPAAGPDWFAWAGRQHVLNIVRQDGGITPVEMDGARIDLDGRSAYQFFFRELTERTRLEQQLRQAERLSAIGQMISGIAHELNNPLAVIMGYLELIMQRHELNPQTRADLLKVAQESNRAAKLVSNFLSFAREQPGRSEAVDLNEVVHHVVELREVEMRVVGIKWQLDLEPALPLTLADRDQVQQVLVNLINNAVHALLDRPLPGQLRISSRASGARLELRVSDNGPGVPPAVRAKIFEPFFTTKEVGTGTGLGLSIAHSIMAEHNGRIAYEDAPGGGACFVLEFPLIVPSGADSHPAGTGETQQLPVPKPAETNGRVARILVLDDEKSIADMLGEMLNLLGHQTTICNSGPQALEELGRSEYDLILSDYRMPGMDGREFFNLASQRDDTFKHRIIFLTGDVVNEQTRSFLQSVGAPYLGKPFHLDTVEEAINGVLKRAETAVPGLN